MWGKGTKKLGKWEGNKSICLLEQEVFIQKSSEKQNKVDSKLLIFDKTPDA